MKFSFGPLLYYWPEKQVSEFYRQVMESDVDVVYVGETVCPKRREVSAEGWLSIAHQVRESGKEVVISTMTLLESPADLRELKRHCDNGEFLVEANDMGAIALLKERGLPFVAGSAINCYNHHVLRQLVSYGMKRWVPPVELSRDWLIDLLTAPESESNQRAFEVELIGFGHLPLAWSARCFTARSEDRPKDQCDLCCIKYPQGKTVFDQEGNRIFVLNGIQTQSGQRYNLVNELSGMAGLVDVVRLNPGDDTVFPWLRRFQENTSGLNPVALDKDDCNGYWLKMAGIRQVTDVDCHVARS